MGIKLYGPEATKAEDFDQLFQEMDRYDGGPFNFPLETADRSGGPEDAGQDGIAARQREILDRLTRLFVASLGQIPGRGRPFVEASPIFLEDRHEPHGVESIDLDVTTQEDVKCIVDYRKKRSFHPAITGRRVGLAALMARTLDLGLDHRSPGLAVRAFRYLAKPITVYDYDSSQLEKLQISEIGWDSNGSRDEDKEGRRIYRKAILQSRLARINERDVGARDYGQIRESLLRHFPSDQEFLLSLISCFESAAIRTKFDRFEGTYMFHVLFSAIDQQIGDLDLRIFEMLTDLGLYLERVESQKDFREAVREFVYRKLPGAIDKPVDFDDERTVILQG